MQVFVGDGDGEEECPCDFDGVGSGFLDFDGRPPVGSGCEVRRPDGWCVAEPCDRLWCCGELVFEAGAVLRPGVDALGLGVAEWW